MERETERERERDCCMTPRQWLNEYEAEGQIMTNATGKKLLTDTWKSLR